jgi:hypothetical protein
VPDFGPFGDPHNAVRLAVDTEEHGWGGLFHWDHISGRPLGLDTSQIGRNMVEDSPSCTGNGSLRAMLLCPSLTMTEAAWPQSESSKGPQPWSSRVVRRTN